MQDMVGKQVYKKKGYFKYVVGTLVKSTVGASEYYIQLPMGRVAVMSERDIELAPIESKQG